MLLSALATWRSRGLCRIGPWIASRDPSPALPDWFSLAVRDGLTGKDRMSLNANSHARRDSWRFGTARGLKSARRRHEPTTHARLDAERRPDRPLARRLGQCDQWRRRRRAAPSLADLLAPAGDDPARAASALVLSAHRRRRDARAKRDGSGSRRSTSRSFPYAPDKADLAAEVLTATAKRAAAECGADDVGDHTDARRLCVRRR